MNSTPLLELLSHTAMKGAAVLLVALLLGLILRKTAASRRYAIWITAIAALAVLPLAMWALPAWRVLPKATTELDWPVLEPEVRSDSAGAILMVAGNRVVLPAAKTELQKPSTVKALSSFSWKISWQDVVSALPLAWMLVAGLLLLRLGLSAWRLRCLEAALTRGESAMVARAARDLGLKRMPRLFIGPADAVPMVWGVLRPRLLLPQGFETWSDEKLRGVLLHELAHLKRGDPLALWVAQWVKALHWFNPLAWLTLRQLRADQERACDDTVLRHGVRASDYAQSLLDLSRHNRLAPGLSLCALTITRCAPVEARVKAILDPTRHRESLTLRWLAGLAACALLLTLPMAMLQAIEGLPLRGRIVDRNGVVLAESTKEKVRNYPLKTLAAHSIGYTRLPDENEPLPFGGAGIEKQQNHTLKAGKDVTLSLDARIQALTLQAMKDGGVERGAAVVLDPRTGEILASVSLPSFDPNLFIPSISFNHWDRYLKDKDIPLLNRVVRGHVPGAAYLPLTALAGIAAGVGDSRFVCDGKMIYGNNVMPCWIHRQNGGRHGELSMSNAFVASCNCFWHQYGNATGIEQIEAMGHKLGFGTKYGISDDESEGILPSPSWLMEYHPKESWSAGFTANTAIGQGFVLATPLHLAVLAATVGNGGKVPQPSLLKQAGATKWRADLVGEGLPEAQLESLREAMRLVVNGGQGTGRKARSEHVEIAGQTGTAQNWRIVNGKRVESNHLWFIGFAPFDKPALAFAILKQGGKSGGSDCAPIAKRIIEETLALPADGSGEVLPVEDAMDSARETMKQVQAQFDAQAEEITREIGLIEKQQGERLKLKQIKISGGRLTLIGEAANMSVALGFKNRLPDIAKRWKIEWNFPLPKPLQDGIRVEFRAEGICIAAASDKDPQEAAAPKTVAPQEVSGAVSNDPQKVAGAAQARLDSDAAEISRQIKLLVKKKGIEINTFKAGQGKMSFIGVCEGIDEVLLFRDELIELGKQWQVTWEVTTPRQVPDRPKTMFMAVGTYKKAPIKVVTPAAIASSAKDWEMLQKFGNLADLPAGAVPDKLTHTESFTTPSVPTLKFAFTASREAVYDWLTASVPANKLESQADKLRELGGTKPFRHDFWIHDNCWVRVECEIARARVLVYRRTMILIAPDESQEPRPAGKLAPDYKQEGVTSVEPLVPWQQLRSMIEREPENALRPKTSRAQPIQLRLHAPVSLPPVRMISPSLQHLAGELGDESVQTLLLSSQNNRKQQALLVKLPPKN